MAAGRPDTVRRAHLLGVRDDLRQGALRLRVGGGPYFLWAQSIAKLAE